MLDIECFSYLNRALDTWLSPNVIFAGNRGIYNVRGTDVSIPRGIPADLLDWSVIVRTKTYDPADMIQILTIRAQVEMNKWFWRVSLQCSPKDGCWEEIVC